MASKAARSKPNRELASLKAQLVGLTEDVLSGELETGRAAVANQLINTRLRAIDLARKIREQDEIEERLAALEALQPTGGVSVMASVNERLERLEAKAAPPHEVSPAMAQLLDAIEDARREIAGLPPLPRPYTTAEREDDIRFLREELPKYRADKGWQGEEGQAILDAWEEETQARLEYE